MYLFNPIFIFYFMKRIVFYIAISIAVLTLLNVLYILIYDFSRLTEYGYGYLVGKLILVIVFSVVAYTTRNFKK